MASDENSYTQIVRGLPFPKGKRFSKKHIEEAMDYKPQDGDIIIASYPKTGTTWMQYIVLQIISKATLFPNLEDATFQLYPYMEMVGKTSLDDLTSPRIYKHHIPYSMVQKNDKSKCIYIYRHPEDTFVSYYHFYQNLHPEIVVDLEEFLDDFVSGKISCGSYFRHVLSFYEHRDDLNVLMVSYETLHSNKREEILRIAKFLSQEHFSSLLKQEDVFNKIMEHTDFNYMKDNLYMRRPQKGDGQNDESPKNVNFFRKGIVGDGKNVLTEKQRHKLKEAAKIKLEGTSIFEKWYQCETRS